MEGMGNVEAMQKWMGRDACQDVCSGLGVEAEEVLGGKEEGKRGEGRRKENNDSVLTHRSMCVSVKITKPYSVSVEERIRVLDF